MKHLRNSGFTLIELMIVAIVVAILATLAYPSYVSYVQKSRRADAKTTLENLRLEQEKWRANNTTYGNLSNVWSGSPASIEGYYTLSVWGNTATNFSATAAPTGVQSGDSCGTFAINQDGPVGGGSYAAINGCWR